MLAMGRAGDRIPGNRSARAEALGRACVWGSGSSPEASRAGVEGEGEEWEAAGTGRAELSVCLCGDFGIRSEQNRGHGGAMEISEQKQRTSDSKSRIGH